MDLIQINMKRYIVILLLFFCSVLEAQNSKNFYYIIKKKDIDNGKIKIVYRDQNDSIHPLKMCYSKMKAEELRVQGGIASFHFESINSTEFDSVTDCISNATKLGRFEIDLRKHTIGDKNRIVKIPFRKIGWGISIVPFRIRFAKDSIPLTTENKLEFAGTYGYSFGYAKINHEEIIHYSLTTGFFGGLTSAPLKKETVTKPDNLKASQNNAAVSYGIMATFARNNFGVSFSFGFDTSLGQNSTLWIYQNKPWIGLGISSSLSMF